MASVPVTEVILPAFTVPVVLSSRVFNAVTSARVVSVVTTASFPNPVISLAPAAYTMFASATVPVIWVTALASTATDVFPYREVMFAAVASASPEAIVIV